MIGSEHNDPYRKYGLPTSIIAKYIHLTYRIMELHKEVDSKNFHKVLLYKGLI